MRLIFLIFISTLISASLQAQKYFPIKLNKKWGLMDKEGKIIQQPVYDAIGEFKQFGYAVMQRNGKVGMLGGEGQEVIQPPVVRPVARILAPVEHGTRCGQLAAHHCSGIARSSTVAPGGCGPGGAASGRSARKRLPSRVGSGARVYLESRNL